VTATSKTSARAQLLFIATIFFGPLLIAAFMYYGGHLQPQGRSNHGALLTPIVSIVAALPETDIVDTAAGRWLLIYPHAGDCRSDCQRALYTIRQARRMLGKEATRLERLFLHDESPPDTVFLAAEHAGLIERQDSTLSALLLNKKPAALPFGGYFLMDPLGNLVMYFEPAIDPGAMVEDIQHLLKLSRIG